MGTGKCGCFLDGREEILPTQAGPVLFPCWPSPLIWDLASTETPCIMRYEFLITCGPHLDLEIECFILSHFILFVQTVRGIFQNNNKSNC